MECKGTHTAMRNSLEDILTKLGSRHGEVQDRALRALITKIEGGLVTLDVVADLAGLPQLLLHWINDRQSDAAPDLVRCSLRLIAALARTPCLSRLHEAGCVRFLEDFRPNAASFAQDVEAAINALLLTPSHSVQHEARGGSGSLGGATIFSQTPHTGVVTKMADIPDVVVVGASDSAPLAAAAARAHPHVVAWAERQPSTKAGTSGSPPKDDQVLPSVRHGASVVKECPTDAPHLREAPMLVAELDQVDVQHVMDLGVRLKFGDAATLQMACRELCDLLADMPAAALISNSAIIDGLCRAVAAEKLGGGSSLRVAAVETICAMFERLVYECTPPTWLRVDHIAEGRRSSFVGLGFNLQRVAERSVMLSLVGDMEQLPPAGALHRLLVELLRSGLRCPQSVALTSRAFGQLIPLCSAQKSRVPLTNFQPAQLQLCVRLAGEALAGGLAGEQREIRSLVDALQWFDALASLPLPMTDSVWSEPLRCHVWSLNALTIFDVFTELLRAVGATGFAEVAASGDLANLVRALLFDYRLLIERPEAAEVLLSCISTIFPEDVTNFRQFREVLGAAIRLDQKQSLGDDSTDLNSLLARMAAYDNQLCLLTLADANMKPQGLLAGVIGLIGDVSHLDLTSIGPEGLPLLQRLKCGTISLCSRLAVCPDAAMQDSFFRLLEAEPAAGWLYESTDFIAGLLCDGARMRARAALSITRWLQGDLAASGDFTEAPRDRISGSVCEFVEFVCTDVSASTVSSAVRRLFLVDAAAREAAALFLWRSDVSQRALSSPCLRFLADPLDSVFADAQHAVQGYAVQGLSASAHDLDHLLSISENTRLELSVRAAALTQLATFAASEPARTQGLLAEASRNLPLLLVNSLRATTLSGEDTDDCTPSAPVEFLTRVCHAGSVLSLASGTHSWAARQLQDHSTALLDRLLLFIFHPSARLRAAALQFSACLMFHPAITICIGGAVTAADAGHLPPVPRELALPVPAWLGTTYKLPVGTRIVQIPKSEAARFWGISLRGSTAALCQIFHRLQTGMGIDVGPLLLEGVEAAAAAVSEGRGCHGSVVWQRTEELLATTSSTEELVNTACFLAFPSPVGEWLLRSRTYLPRLLSGMSPPSHPSRMTADSTFRSRSQRTTLAELHLRPLEHLLAVLNGLPQGSLCDRRPLEQIADLLCSQVMPNVWELATSLASRSELTEGSIRSAHCSLAADAMATQVVDALLRCTIVLARRGEMSLQWLLSTGWIAPLAVLVSSSTRCLKRHALAMAVYIVPALVSDGRLNGPTQWASTGGQWLLQALAGSLAAPSASLASLQHSFDVKAALCLVGTLAQAGITGSSTPGVAASCITHWLSHKDFSLRGLAWRNLRILMYHAELKSAGHSRGGSEEAAAFARALRVLRVHGTTLSVAESMMYTEVVEFINSALKHTQTVPGRREAFAKQVLEAEILSGELLPMCLASGHRHLQSASIRFLHSLYLAETPAVHGILLQSGLWPRAVAVLKANAHVKGRRLCTDACDSATLMADVTALVCAAMDFDLQMLLWLTSSTDIIVHWHSALEDLMVAGTEVPPRRYAKVVAAHVDALLQAACVVQSQLSPTDGTDSSFATVNNELPHVLKNTDNLSQMKAWLPAMAIFRGSVVASLLGNALSEQMPTSTRQAAAATLATLCGLSSIGVDFAIPANSEETFSRRACDFFLWCAACPTPQSTGSVSVEAEAVLHCCLANLFRVSPAAAHTAWRTGFLNALGRRIATLVSQSEPRRCNTIIAAAGHGAPTGNTSMASTSIPQVVGVIRVLSALMASCPDALEDATCGRPDGTPINGSPVLLAVLQCVRSASEKDDCVCLEVMDMLCQCVSAEMENGVESLPGFLLRHEFVHWMMRLSQRRQVSSVIFCRTLGLLSFCGSALAGKPGLFKYIGHLAEVLGSLSRNQATQLADKWRCRRVVATLRFIASQHLCSKCTALLVSPRPSAHSSAQSSAEAGLGMDFWLDLIEPDLKVPISVRIATLQVLLAVAMSHTPLSKACFLTSGRAPPLLLRLLNAGPGSVIALAVNILWVLAHGSQRAVQLLRRLQASEVIKRADLLSKEDIGESEDHGALLNVMVGQLQMILS